MSRITRSPESGFTLIELLAVMLVGGILLAALTSFYLSEQRAFRQQQIQIETSQSLRVALEQIVRDLRVAGRNPTGATGIGILEADSSVVRFSLDSDGDGTAVLTSRDEHKGFRGNGTTIQTYVADAGVSGPWQDLAGSTAVPGTITVTFTYHRDDGTPITSLPASAADRQAIRRVDVVLTATNRVPGAPDISRREIGSIQLRNLG